MLRLIETRIVKYISHNRHFRAKYASHSRVIVIVIPLAAWGQNIELEWLACSLSNAADYMANYFTSNCLMLTLFAVFLNHLRKIEIARIMSQPIFKFAIYSFFSIPHLRAYNIVETAFSFVTIILVQRWATGWRLGFDSR
jgi:hypothetical protein